MKTLVEILASQALKPYVDKAHQLICLNKTWHLYMEDWAGQCEVANFEGGQLVLQVKNAAMATRLRYAIPEIIKKLSSIPEFSQITRIQCRIFQPSLDKQEQAVISNKSSQAKAALNEVAELIESSQLNATFTKTRRRPKL